MNLLTKALAAALIAGGGWSLAGSANAVPLGRASLSLRDASTPVVETVQYRRRGWVGRRGVGVGLAVGAIAAGAIVASTYPAYSYGYPAYSYGYPAYSGYAPGYGYGYGYASPSPAYGYGYNQGYYGGGYAPAYYGRRVLRRW